MKTHEYAYVDDRARSMFHPDILIKMLEYAEIYYNRKNTYTRTQLLNLTRLEEKFDWGASPEGYDYWSALIYNAKKTPLGITTDTIIDGQRYVV